MVIMVNRYSASASDLFAAAMQDYHRAIIVGDTTFGKSTAQRIFSITKKYADEEESLKITTGYFYRPTGKSHQNIGVVPDIVLGRRSIPPVDAERLNPTALPQQNTDKKTYFTPLPEIELSEIKKESEQRQHAHYTKLNSDNLSRKIPLNLKGFKAWEEAHERPANQEFDWKVTQNKYYESQDTDSQLLDYIHSSFKVYESFNIINDLIQQKQP